MMCNGEGDAGGGVTTHNDGDEYNVKEEDEEREIKG